MRTTLLTLSFCLFFAANTFAQRTIPAEEILSQINRGEDVNYNNVKISGVLDLTNLDNRTSKKKGDSWFGNNRQYESTVEGSISFTNCAFLDDVIAYYNEDDDTYIAHFEEDVIFEKCVFERASEFKYSEFEEKASFAHTVFEEEANFKYAKFSDGPDFSACVFDDDANFKYADFSDQPRYTNVLFEEEANFKYAKFPDGVSFQSAVFNDLANFKYTKFSSPLNLDNVSFNGDEDFKYTEIDGKDFTSYLIKTR
ncbi:pentapeptide repeat-containing protein [Catalinimonas sp. 4WD22]|uniref:pentapeptide repeat-containing protein n=1 Tax=Catalinimonas locisalis TaxID=3133978 RepID=UPI003100EFB7